MSIDNKILKFFENALFGCIKVSKKSKGIVFESKAYWYEDPHGELERRRALLRIRENVYHLLELGSCDTRELPRGYEGYKILGTKYDKQHRYSTGDSECRIKKFQEAVIILKHFFRLYNEKASDFFKRDIIHNYFIRFLCKEIKFYQKDNPILTGCEMTSYKESLKRISEKSPEIGYFLRGQFDITTSNGLLIEGKTGSLFSKSGRLTKNICISKTTWTYSKGLDEEIQKRAFIFFLPKDIIKDDLLNKEEISIKKIKQRRNTILIFNVYEMLEHVVLNENFHTCRIHNIAYSSKALKYVFKKFLNIDELFKKIKKFRIKRVVEETNRVSFL